MHRGTHLGLVQRLAAQAGEQVRHDGDQRAVHARHGACLRAGRSVRRASPHLQQPTYTFLSLPHTCTYTSRKASGGPIAAQ